MILEKLRNLTPDTKSIEELVELSALAQVYRDHAEKLGVETPDWFDSQVKRLHREIRDLRADDIEARLTKMKLSLRSLRTPEEKRQALQQEIDKLESLKASA